ncbi:tetratricopeptide repeat protein [Alcanivorax quisquiliarum]|uniref:Flp pilus assembly protein TadD, contains TPR repeats n=1 Tax=Alcanivorax quisquiliarum TaxID=2933565 RepID=A0ABT0E5H2_9GAMM|nr:hypothetical protein [Alcanivorax quisquiliarum]MCK0536988.1 hypothetical protein [Alcanivorax quisquiliarum]
MRCFKTALIIAFALAAGGCANRPLNGGYGGEPAVAPTASASASQNQTAAPARPQRSDFRPRVNCSARIAPEERVELEMVDTLSARGRHYAALAQLQKTEQRNIEYWLRYGQLQAKTQQLPRARAVFETLVDRCDTGEARHGLGMVMVKQNELQRGLAELQRAARMLPASAAVRNDYGYALMMAGRHDQARFELLTALELENGSGRARQNLAAAYFLAGDSAGLEHLQQHYHYTDDELNHARDLANQLRRF